MPVENEEGNDSVQSGPSQEQLGNINEAFEATFSKLSDSDAAEAGDSAPAENTAAPKQSPRQKAEYARQQRVEEGQENDDGEEVDPETQDTDAADKEDATEDTEVQEGEQPAESQEDPTATLDPNHLFAAQQLGWTNEKIAKLAKADPELAAETLASLSDTYNTLSRQMLIPGSLVNPGTPIQQPAQATTPTTQLDKFYAQLQQFTEANGEDLGGFAKALNEEVIQPFKQMLAEAESARENSRRTEAQTTMKSLADKFGDFYGKGEAALTPVQQMARGQLAQVADQLRSGAQLQGRPLSITEAINRAHLIVASQYQRQAVRTEIKQNLQKRSKAITAKPTQRTNPSAGRRGVAKATEAISQFWADKGEVDGE